MNLLVVLEMAIRKGEDEVDVIRRRASAGKKVIVGGTIRGVIRPASRIRPSIAGDVVTAGNEVNMRRFMGWTAAAMMAVAMLVSLSGCDNNSSSDPHKGMDMKAKP